MLPVWFSVCVLIADCSELEASCLDPEPWWLGCVLALGLSLTIAAPLDPVLVAPLIFLVDDFYTGPLFDHPLPQIFVDRLRRWRVPLPESFAKECLGQCSHSNLVLGIWIERDADEAFLGGHR